MSTNSPAKRQTDATPPLVCVLTSSFPRWRGDLSGHFILAEIQGLADSFGFRVIAPSDADTDDRDQPFEELTLKRFRYFFPKRLQRLAYGDGIPENVKRFRSARWNAPFFLAAMTAAVGRWGRKTALIHAHWSLSALAAVLARPLHRRPIAVTLRGSDIHGKSKLLSIGNRYALRRVNAVLPVSVTMVPLLKQMGVSEDRITVLPGSMHTPSDAELEQAQGDAIRSKTGRTRIVFVGRLAQVKAVDRLIDAVAERVNQGDDLEVCIVGDGAQRAELETQVDRLNLSERFEFVGQQPTSEVPRYLAGGDMFVLCSKSEGLPFSLWEAMSHGLPCIATRVGGVEELAEDGKTGLLIESGQPKELSEAIGKLAGDEQLRRRLGQAARARTLQQSGSQATICQTLENVYRDLMAN